MKKVTSIFQLLLALFFGVALVFFLAFDSVRNGFGIQELTAGNVVVWLLVGLVLFLISWFFQSMYTSSLNRKIKRLELERNEIKAKLYDLEKKTGINQDNENKSSQEEDRESSVIKPRQNFK
ncbi:hypothetical protein QWY93_05030 [Echinicola jeungdonensis]|uniref:Lipopolysaccharide assembly protein A domain-containing protein n=1 Tax=Echinicola jeungdonensis TaxID=709343 RepID=A0ABV5J597_9BACT|nr:hypothetical protein [Echinicola jeungdonensis]MDN3668687.1 hypothetical protein [Echinicola jeungdonensis]